MIAESRLRSALRHLQRELAHAGDEADHGADERIHAGAGEVIAQRIGQRAHALGRIIRKVDHAGNDMEGDAQKPRHNHANGEIQRALPLAEQADHRQ